VNALQLIEGFFDAEGCVKVIKEKVRKTPKVNLDFLTPTLPSSRSLEENSTMRSTSRGGLLLKKTRGEIGRSFIIYEYIARTLLGNFWNT
jgi:hypothetical protein